MVTVRIRRSKWSRGNCDSCNMLLVETGNPELNKFFKHGNMCCLGFACLALGAKKKDILGLALPDMIADDKVREKLTGLVNSLGDSSQFALDAAEINDNDEISARERERELRQLAKENGFRFVFVP